MQSVDKIKQGDFTGLAENYSLYRPGYSETVLDAILGIVKKPIKEINFVDVGAGTGIWTRMVASRGCFTAKAVEPNEDMRLAGKKNQDNGNIVWFEGAGEQTGLADNSADLLSMASSFHWVDFPLAEKEFHRILKPEGRFVALWNPRFIHDNPVLIDIDQKMKELCPTLSRVSSGSSEFVKNLSEKMLASHYFTDLVYLEGRHTVNLTKQQYMGVWRSVNDVRAQMGEAVFETFMHYMDEKISDHELVKSTYLTRAWMVKRKS